MVGLVLTGVVAAVGVSSAPPPSDALAEALVEHVEADGLGVAMFPTCWSDGEHAMCYAVIGLPDVPFGVGYSVDDVTDPVFELLFMGPFGGTFDQESSSPADPPTADELTSRVTDFLTSGGVSIIDFPISAVECGFPAEPEQGVPYPCNFGPRYPDWGMEFVFDVNWNPHPDSPLHAYPLELD